MATQGSIQQQARGNASPVAPIENLEFPIFSIARRLQVGQNRSDSGSIIVLTFTCCF
jgi:hypothetical protein